MTVKHSRAGVRRWQRPEASAERADDGAARRAEAEAGAGRPI
jgi:hypothetical protein